jgi:SAM-dependent methyltransferase
METGGGIIELGGWLETPPGQYLLAWEQGRLDRAVADVFGYHALQVGLPEIDTLRLNRMPHRWVSHDGLAPPPRLHCAPPVDPELASTPVATPVALSCDPDALPFPNNSLDLVVLPHTLELAEDPHRALSEATRVLVPDGRMVIVGFNPASLWGLRQRLGRVRRGLALGAQDLYLPSEGEFINYWRLRDWMRLLGLEIQAGRFGCYRPPVRTDKWLQRWDWMEPAGDRWWPVLGAVYFLVAVRRVPAMRLVGRVKRRRVRASPAPAVVAGAQHRR